MRFAQAYSLFFALLLLLSAGCAVNPATGKRQLALMNLSPAEEAALGEKTFPRALQQMGGVYPDKRLEAYVSEVGKRLAAVSHRPELTYHFAVVNDSAPNAFALPGGYIAISRGLLVNLENEAELAAVLGHEIGHVTARHAVQGMQRGTLLDLAVAVLSGASQDTGYGVLAEQAGALGANLIDRTYSREQERESDRLGIDYMVQAGYDPYGSVQLQEFFSEQVEGEASSSWLAGLFRTHPFSRERLEANRDYVWQRYPKAVGKPSSRLGADALTKALVGLRASQEGYLLYDKAQKLEANGDLQGAIATYLDAVQAAPDQALIYVGLALAHLRAEDLLPAQRYLNQALRLDDGYYRTHAALGYIYLKQDKAQKSVTHLERAMELLPSINSAFLLAEGYEKIGRRDEALDLYRQVAQADDGKLGQAAKVRLRELGGL